MFFEVKKLQTNNSKQLLSITSVSIRKKTRPEALLKPLEAPLEILGEPHIPKEQLASSGEFHPVRLDALSQSRVEVLFHAAKVRKGLIYANIIY